MATSSAVAFEGAEQDDAQIIRQVLQGNTAMFELLMRRYNERVYRAARAIVRDEHEAEDVMQQAYVNAFTHLRQFNGSAQFSTWLTRIAINEALARVRRQGRYEVFDDELSNVEPLMSSNPSENPEREAFTGELRVLLEWAIDTLPDGMREVFVSPGRRRPQHVGSGRVPRGDGGCRQDPPVALSRGVEARPARTNGRDST
jgi:RNA polymerase sigma factor (sigma-70 family)